MGSIQLTLNCTQMQKNSMSLPAMKSLIKLGVMDLTAICLSRDPRFPSRFWYDRPGALLDNVMGKQDGTLINIINANRVKRGERMIDDIISDAVERMTKSLGALDDAFKRIRTAGASQYSGQRNGCLLRF